MAVDGGATGDNRPPSRVDGVAMNIGVGVLSQGGRMTTLTRAEIGALGERLAADHLAGLGLRILARNWRHAEAALVTMLLRCERL